VKPCEHKRISRGAIWECCLDCGATRRLPDQRGNQEPWHTCAACRFGPPKLPGRVVFDKVIGR